MELDWLLIVVALFIGFGLGRYWSKKRPGDSQNDVETATQQTPESDTSDLSAIAKSLETPAEETAHPSALLAIPEFERGVSLLTDEKRSISELLTYLKGENWIISCIAGEALCRRKTQDDVYPRLLKHIRYMGPWPLYFVLKYLRAADDEPLIGAVLVQTQQWWTESRPMISVMTEFIGERTGAGEKPHFSGLLDHRTDEEISGIAEFLDVLNLESLEPLRAELTHWQNSNVNVDELNRVGRVWHASQEVDVIEHAALSRHADHVQSYLQEPPHRSVLLVGDTGVGKTSLVKVLAHRMQQSGWALFEAGASDVLAGQVYIGELEERIKSLLNFVGVARRVLWYAPEFHEFLYAGSHRYDPSGLLDRILPAIEERRIVLLGETTPQGYGRLVQERPRLRSTMDACHISSLSDSETLSIAIEWAKRRKTEENAEILHESTIAEAQNIVKQCLAEKGAPGSILDVLKATHKRIASEEQVRRAISVSDVLTTLSQITGLPQAILDDRHDLDIEILRGRFKERIIGQSEAVNAIVNRIAMVKAGLNDPSRPLGVFLFVGPTGTGKTEIAKTLARFLFGSEERMIRLDMSEFQTADAMDRILGVSGERTGNSLVDLVRKQPFSVVLLDEFEKAHPKIWDLFLQLFDDGRLTDRSGNLGDFRHSIVILTSNLGARISSGTNIGFTLGDVSFSRSAVEREVKGTFRPEFINRIDQVVIFHPLSRDVMRQILRRELEEVLDRRGFRKRSWAVEWDESAVDFLLQQGFTPDLGARPLRRAIERYLLSPLSITIVQHEFPEGDQFLFITSDGKEIKAEFVDPDEPAERVPAPDEQEELTPDQAEQEIRLKTLALDARGLPEELSFLKGELKRLEEITGKEEWRSLKQESLAQTSVPGFWDIPERFEILSNIEVMDRIESGQRAADSLIQRLSGGTKRTHMEYRPELLRRLAEQLYLLDTACSDFLGNRSHDAFVLMETQHNPHASRELLMDFFQRINRMYLDWAGKRRMRYQQLQMKVDNSDYCRSVLAVSGFGAFTILEPENGLHVLEMPKDQRAFQRGNVRVRVVPQPKEFARDGDSLLKQAEATLLAVEEGTPQIVRRYRMEPSPLVRDSVRNWRTGRIERVFAGDFDLIR